jgi:predicted AAA+ superfamily ATPase
MEIKRDYYLNKLIESEGNGLVKIITGVRRCGKSFLLFTLFKDHLLKSGVNEDHIIQLDFDVFENKKYRDPEAAFAYVNSRIVDKDKYYLLFDEIQLLGDFESVLNSFMKRENVDVYATGSNSHMLSSDIATEFRGRSWQIRIYPFSYKEFKDAHKDYESDKAFDEYTTYGGMPYLMNLTNNKDKIAYLKGLFEQTYLKDIIDRNHLKSNNSLKSVIDVLCSAEGSLSNPHKIAKTFESTSDRNVSEITVSHYIEYLKDAFLLSEAKRYDIKGRDYISATSKFYFVDPGIRNAIIGFRQVEPNHIMESIIFFELLRRGYSVDVGVINVQRLNEENKKQRVSYEVDFVCNQGSERTYIQSAFAIDNEEKMNEEKRSLKKIDDSFKKIIITKGRMSPRYDDDGILHVGLYDFLEGSCDLN